MAETAASSIQEQVEAAVAAATEAFGARIAEKDARISELESVVAANAQESEVAAVKMELDVAQASLKAAEERAEKAEAETAAVIAYLEAEKAKSDVRDERVAAVRELNAVSDERIAARADEWAALSDDVFTALLDDLRAKTTEPQGTSTLPSQTAMTATAEPKFDRQKDFELLAGLRARGFSTTTI